MPSDPPVLPKIHFDSATLPESERFLHWSAAVPAYDVTLPPEAPPFEALVDAWMIGGLIVTHSRLSPVRFVRTSEKAQIDEVDHYSFLLFKRGRWTGKVGQRMMTVGPGQLVVFDLRQPMQAQGEGADSITVSVARRAVKGLAPHANLHGAILDGASGRLLADYFLSLVDQLPALELADAPAVENATTSLISACLASYAERDVAASAGSPVRHDVMRYIDLNLSARDLSPETICRDLGLSRSVLYRAFQPGKGIAFHIRTRRLEAVHVLLNDPAERRGIAEIAYEFGFVSDAHFSRAFRQRFGYSPRDARRNAALRLKRLAELTATDDAPGRFRAWLDEIG